MNTATSTQYFIQTSTDGGKSFDTVKRTTSRTQAFIAYENTARTERTRMFKNNTMILATHIEDAQAELNSLARPLDRIDA
jgi:hypothetical protein